MDTYSPRVHHFSVPFFVFIVGEISLQNDLTRFGWTMYALGILAGIVILYAFIAEIQRVNHIDEHDQMEDENDDADLPPQQTHVTISDGRGNMKLFDLPASPRQLEALATGLLVAHDPFTQRRWTPLKKGRPFSRSKFETLVGEMVARGLAYQINKDYSEQGFDLTVIGRKVLMKYIPSPIATEINPETGDVSHARTGTRISASTTA